MSWFRIEGRMPHHRKIAPLSDAAFRLHITAGCWSVEERTEGLIPIDIPATLPAAPRGKALKRCIDELATRGVWQVTPDGYQIHDFLDYNLSNEQAEAKARAGRAGGKQSGRSRRSKNEASASAVLQQNGSKNEASASVVLQQNGSKSEAESETDPEGRSPPAPPGEPPKLSFADRCRLTLKDRMRAHQELGDVTKWPETAEICGAFEDVWGRKDTPRNGADPRAQRILELGADGVSPSEMVRAIRGSKLSEHIASKREFQSLKTILRDAAQVDKFSALLDADSAPALPSGGGYVVSQREAEQWS